MPYGVSLACYWLPQQILISEDCIHIQMLLLKQCTGFLVEMGSINWNACVVNKLIVYVGIIVSV